MESPKDILPDSDLEHRKRVALEIIEELKTVFLKRSRVSRICIEVVTLSIGIIAIIATFYGPPFSDQDRNLWSVLWGPSETQQVKLSDLMTTTKPLREAVYILALDVSGSLLEEKVSSSSVTLFSNRLTADGVDFPGVCELGSKGVTRWHLARAQLCCYLHQFEEGSRVGLWKFGRDPALLSESKSHQLERVNNTLEIEARGDLLDLLMSPATVPKPGTPEYDETNFEKLLDRLYEGYIEDPAYEGKDLHFVIVSDFVHDAGAKDHPSFVLSMEKIAEKFEDIGKVDNAIFHLVATGANNSEVNSVMRVVQKAAVWYQYRVDSFERSSSDPMPDFLFNFVPSKGRLVFYNAAFTSRVNSINLIWDEDLPEQDDSRIIVGLMADTYGATNKELPIHVAEGRLNLACPPPKRIDTDSDAGILRRLKSKVLKPGDRHEFTIRNSGDHLCVKPLSSNGDGADNFKLTFSRSGKGADRKIYVVDIRFQRFLPKIVSVVLFVCLGVLLISLTYLIVAFIRRAAGRE